MEDTKKRQALTALAAADKAFRDHERGLWLAVQVAREQGASWDEIGKTLGVSRQAAHERFTKEPRR